MAALAVTMNSEVAKKVVIPVENGANNISFCSTEGARSVVAVGGPSKIGIKAFQFLQPEQGDDAEEGVVQWLDMMKLKHVLDVVYLNTSVITWSPATSLTHSQFKFSACSSDTGAVTTFSSTLEETTCEILSGHRSAVNDLCAHPTEEGIIASVGDDCTCRVWDLHRAELRSEYKLGSPGRSVRWHAQDPEKLMVAERGGRVRLYDTSTDCPILSLDCPRQPLLDVDWAPSNSLLLGGVAGGSWFIWDLSYSSQPLESKATHKVLPTRFRWCPQSDKVFATLSTSSQVKVHHLAHKKVPLTCDLVAVSDIAWHSELPLLVAASSRSLSCWQVELQQPVTMTTSLLP